MSPFIVGLLVPLGAFAMIFGIVYMIITARNRERMALIERGADPTLFESVKKGHTNGIFKWGLFFVGIGAGIFIANIMVSAQIMNDGAAYPSMIFLFGGLALIGAHHWIGKPKKQNLEM